MESLFEKQIWVEAILGGSRSNKPPSDNCWQSQKLRQSVKMRGWMDSIFCHGFIYYFWKLWKLQNAKKLCQKGLGWNFFCYCFYLIYMGSWSFKFQLTLREKVSDYWLKCAQANLYTTQAPLHNKSIQICLRTLYLPLGSSSKTT